MSTIYLNLLRANVGRERCEVQFYYGLQQRRFLPLNIRPTVFVTPAGKEVKVSQKVAVKNDMRMTAGRVDMSHNTKYQR